MQTSIKPKDMVSGGLFGDVNATVKKSRYELYDYNKTIRDPIIAAAITTNDDDGKEVTEYYSAAQTPKFQIIDDGKDLQPVSPGTPLNNNTNFAFLLEKLIEAGFPEDRLEGVASLEGLYAHWMRVPAPERGGQGAKDSQGRAKTIAVPSKIIKLPWESKPSTPGSKIESGTPDLEGAAVDYITKFLSEKGGTATRKQLNTGAFTRVDKAIRNDVVKLLSNGDFLDGLAEAGLVVIDGDSVALG